MICTLGDLLLDVVVRLDGPIAEDTDTYGRTRVGPGGQAANVAAWTAALGGRARFIGKRADDPAGVMLADELRRRGVELAGPVQEAGTGTVVSVATPDGKRTMLTDRGIAPGFASRTSSTRPGSKAANGSTSPATASRARRSGRPRSPPPRSRRA